MSMPRDLIKLTFVLAVAAAVAAGITGFVTWTRSRRTGGDLDYHPWDHTVSTSESAS